MVKGKRDPTTGRFVSTKPRARKIEPKESVPDFGVCSTCGSKLVKLLVNSRAEVPEYVLVCDNRECGQYRVIVK